MIYKFCYNTPKIYDLEEIVIQDDNSYTLVQPIYITIIQDSLPKLKVNPEASIDCAEPSKNQVQNIESDLSVQNNFIVGEITSPKQLAEERINESTGILQYIGSTNSSNLRSPSAMTIHELQNIKEETYIDYYSQHTTNFLRAMIVSRDFKCYIFHSHLGPPSFCNN